MLLKKYETVSNILNPNTADDITTIANYLNVTNFRGQKFSRSFNFANDLLKFFADTYFRDFREFREASLMIFCEFRDEEISKKFQSMCP